MENASKALAIAGGILIAVMILVALVSMVQNSSQYSKSVEEQKKIEQITKFNKEYESYQKKLMRGTDVITVINKANNNNIKNVYDVYGNIENEEAKITTKIEIKYGDIEGTDNDGNKIIIMKNGKYTIGNYNKDKYNTFNDNNKDTKIYDEMINNADALKAFKRRFFKCTGINYNNNTGLVNELSFEEVDVGSIPDY